MQHQCDRSDGSPQFDICRYIGFVVFLFPFIFPSLARAQWLEQRVELRAGWNSVYLTIDPAPADADVLFSHGGIETVWAYSHSPINPTVPNCPQPSNPDPDCPAPDVQHWQVWQPPSHGGSVINSLRVIRGGRVYQIKASRPVTLNLIGRPHSKTTQWQAGFNLVGFHVSPSPTPADLPPRPKQPGRDDVDDSPDSDALPDDLDTAPPLGDVIPPPPNRISFMEYLTPSPVHAASRIFQRQPDGHWQEIAFGSAIHFGEGYWVTAANTSDYDGPLDIDDASLRGIDFGRSMTEHPLEIRNRDLNAGEVNIEYVPSSLPPTDPAKAGEVPVRWLDYGFGSDRDSVYQWYELDAVTWPMGPRNQADGILVLRLAAHRAGLSTALVDLEGHGAQYQGLIRVSDGRGYERHLPLALQRGPSAGLWVGDVLVNEVAFTAVAGSGDSVTPRPTAQPFGFRLIMHEGLAGVHLLNEVTLMSTETSGEGNVLVTPDCDPGFFDTLIPASLQNGQPFAPRISTANFSFDNDLLLNGTLGGMIEGSTNIPADHRLNPFKHRYHPDHDGDNVGESYDVTRSFTMTFSIDPPPEYVGAGYGSEVWGGTWEERLSGLHRRTIHVRGSFLIYRLSAIEVLNQPSGG